MIKAVLFDYGGVLAEGGKRDSALGIITNFYGTELPRERYEQLHVAMRCGELTTREFFNAIAYACKSDRIMTETDWHIANAPAYVRSEPVYDLSKTLREQGIRTGIISNIHGFEAEEIRRHGNYDGFDPVVLSCDVHTLKPNRKIYEAALGALALQPSEVLLVDDQLKCNVSAQELNIQTVLAVTPEQIVNDVALLIEEQNT